MVTDADQLAAMRALRDCGVIRTSAMLRRFDALHLAGLATCEYLRRGARWFRDYRLSPKGAQVAAIILA